jgi:hypothetical protein
MNLLERFVDPFKRFHRMEGSGILMPIIDNVEGMVLGFNTARSWQPHLRWQEGAARSKDIEAAREVLSKASSESFKAVAARMLVTLGSLCWRSPSSRSGRSG